jgi:hypothetical protein
LIIYSGAIRDKERELLLALQSQQHVKNCLFNGHSHASFCSTSSGHSSPTHHLIDTNNNPTTGMFYPPSAITPPPANAPSNLDPNAQDFCLLALSASNN